MIAVTNPEFRQRLAQVVREAIQRYESMSGMGPWNTPESWMQCAVAQSLGKEFYVMLEVRTRDILQWNRDERRTTPAQEPALVRNGRVDIVLFERSPDVSDPGEAETVALIEMKKYARRFDCNEDSNRLRGLAKEIQLTAGTFIVAYLQSLSDEKLKSDIRCLLFDIDNSEPAGVETFVALDEHSQDKICAVVVAELRPQYDAVEVQKLQLIRDAVQSGIASGTATDFSFASLNARLDREAERETTGGQSL